MDEREFLAERFEGHRTHLKAVAYRMLGSLAEADDAVQEAWLKLSRSNAGDIENLGGWLTTVVGRVCLDMLRSRTSRREDPLEQRLPDPVVSATATDPEYEALVADSVGLALLVVLQSLTPAERLAFVLHDTFGVPFEDIAPIVGRSPAAARQLASRARRRVRGTAPDPERDPARQRAVVDAFNAAANDGDFEALVAVLAPDVVLRADVGAIPGGWTEVVGAENVAGQAIRFRRTTRGQVMHALVNGTAGIVWFQDGRPQSVLAFTVADDRVTAIDILADHDRLAALDLVYSG
ncbi:RNA polymerase sigma-70 factor (ECF subfamily) [Actinomadura coerulea]|uniref:RNA polymerase sigma-70 factor (ECF subfamily) n=1 Tax=Actinomadura coerulea TaxID=46159 RepID=A0A7X0KWJ7_9ACTN|nr:sigma-70 family RNA polymerase sigma factor [Actinomadura coerulea]MBB6393360.1 RNA polymerase sigma-70 factor (ECF subfamily) [Actinomadura coerulea]GGQ38114.1 DNA-directed RNA polymerase sigma-70 factor [Actinomadura coerulea]